MVVKISVCFTTINKEEVHFSIALRRHVIIGLGREGKVAEAIEL